MLCAACSDTTSGVNTEDVAEDVVDDNKKTDTTTIKKINVETPDGATFETKGKGYSEPGSRYSEDEISYVLDSYKGDGMMATVVDEVYSDVAVPSVVPGDASIPVDYEDVSPRGGGDDLNGRTYGLLTASEWNDLDNWNSWAEILFGEFASKTGYWEFYPRTNRLLDS